jgi:hypothetical protein
MIAFDSVLNENNQTAAGSVTISFTNTAGDILFVAHVNRIGDTTTGITYNGVAMTQIAKTDDTTGNQFYLYYLLAPATGAHNIVISYTGSGNIRTVAASYSGAKHSGQPDASTTANGGSASSATLALSSITDQCWFVMVAWNGQDWAESAGAGATARGSGNLKFFDSNNYKSPAGSYSMTIDWSASGSTNFAAFQASFQPATLIATAHRRTLLGVGT